MTPPSDSLGNRTMFNGSSPPSRNSTPHNDNMTLSNAHDGNLASTGNVGGLNQSILIIELWFTAGAILRLT